MIRSEHGMVMIKGSSSDVAMDLICIIKSVRDAFKSAGLSDEEADDHIRECGMIAYMDIEELERGIMNE